MKKTNTAKKAPEAAPAVVAAPAPPSAAAPPVKKKRRKKLSPDEAARLEEQLERQRFTEMYTSSVDRFRRTLRDITRRR